MSLGADLKEIFTEMGMSYTVARNSVTVGSEYGEVIINSQATKPFIVLNFLKLVVPYDSVILGGDHVIFVDGREYIITAKNPEYVENALIKSECVLLKTNGSVKIERPSEEDDGNEYDDAIEWTEVTLSEPVLLTESLRDQESIVDDIGTFEDHGMELYISGVIGIKIGDRLHDGDDKYVIETVKRKRYDNVHMASLGLDTRP
jgi:hypothetical protein